MATLTELLVLVILVAGAWAILAQALHAAPHIRLARGDGLLDGMQAERHGLPVTAVERACHARDRPHEDPAVRIEHRPIELARLQRTATVHMDMNRLADEPWSTPAWRAGTTPTDGAFTMQRDHRQKAMSHDEYGVT
jgi:hypothetical protein